jgi:hypothetical protein
MAGNARQLGKHMLAEMALICGRASAVAPHIRMTLLVTAIPPDSRVISPATNEQSNILDMGK